MIDSERRLGFQLWWGAAGARQQVYQDPGARTPAVDEMFTVMAVVDVAAATIELWTPWDMHSVAYVDLGHFDNASGLRIGDIGLAGWDGIIGKVANVFSIAFDGDETIGFTRANFDNYLKYTEGLI
jgi:hypothetical protein